MYAKITRDFLSEQDNGIGSRWEDYAGIEFGEKQTTSKGNLLKTRLLDDDRNVYYEVDADNEALEAIFEWAMRDSGCTILQTQDENGEWVDTLN